MSQNILETHHTFHQNQGGLSRRKALGIIGLGGATLLWNAYAINKDSHGTFASALSSLVSRPEAAAPIDERLYYDQYDQFNSRLGIDHHAWIDGRVARGLDKGLGTYWGIPFTQALPVLLDHLESMGITTAEALPVLGYWGENKIGTPVMDATEIGVQLAQTALSFNVNAVDATVSDIVRKPNVIRKLLTQKYSPVETFPLDTLSREKTLISIRTVGFFDKEPINYARAINHSINVGASKHASWDPQFVDTLKILEETNDQIQKRRIQRGSIYTEYDDKYIEEAHAVEKYIILHGRQLDFGVQSTAAFMRHHQDLIDQTSTNFNWNTSHPSKEQHLIRSYWSMCGSDIFAQNYYIPPRDPLFNPRIDAYADPEVIIPYTISEFTRQIPEITEQQYWENSPDSLNDILTRQPIPNCIYTPYYRNLIP